MHDKRVMSVMVHDGWLYSISEDKHLKVRDVEQKCTVWDVSPTGHALQSMERDGNRLFVSCAGGKVAIYDIGNRQCSLQTIVANNSNQKIREISFDPIRNYIFSCAANGEICIINAQKPGKEKFAQVNASFDGYKKNRCLAWSNTRAEGMIGDDDGIVTFINEKNGEAICN